jgi:hypothetical protein
MERIAQKCRPWRLWPVALLADAALVAGAALAAGAALVAGALMTLSMTIPAAAQNATPPAATCPDQPEMTFTAWTSTLGQTFGEGPREYIFADGFFCPDTDKKFQQFLTQNPPKAPNTIVVLNSGGGNLAAGVRMGLIIRQQKMWTEVGSQLPLMIPQNENIPAQTVPYLSELTSPPFAGECASACTFTFMGGVSRTIGYGSNYAVHQFESDTQTSNTDLQAATEVTSAQLVAYLNQMGISPNFMVDMVQKKGNDVTNLSMKELQQLNIVTPRWQSKWQITALNDNSGFYLNGTTTDRWGTHEIAFVCPPAQPTPAQPTQGTSPPAPPPMTAVFYLDLGSRAKAEDLTAAVQGYVLLQSGVFVTSIIPAHQPPAVYSNRLSVELTIPQGLLTSLESQPNIGIAFLINPAAKLPMRLLKFESGLDGALLKQFAAACPH